MASLPRVVIRRRSARPFFARHPWVFVTSIERVEGEPAPGDEVEVVSFEGQFIARGLFNPHSAIRVRLYRWDGGPIDDEFLARSIRSAARWRVEGLGLDGPEVGARLVFSEADGLSGLTVDRFGHRIVASAPAVALARRNAEANGLGAARFEVGDVMESIERFRSEGRKFGLVVCDPPKFARHPKGIEKALRAYLNLNLAVISLLEPDG